MLLEPTKVESNFYTKNVDPEMRGATVSIRDMYGARMFSKSRGNKCTVHDANFAFLSTALAKLHEKPAEPKHFVTYTKDVPQDIGGGFVDYIEMFEVNWAGIMDEFRNIFGNNANYIPRVNAGLNQKKVNVYTFEVAYDLRFIELEKMNKIKLAKSIQTIYKDIITAGWDLFCQKIAYTGIQGGHGLFNHPNVQITMIDNTGTTGKGFEGLTDEAIASFFNGIFEAVLLNTNGGGYSVLPDTILVPTFVGKDMTGRINDLYTSNLRKFIVEHNLGLDESDESFHLTISSRPDLDSLGTGGHGRIVAYRKDKDYVRLDIPYVLQHYITLPNMERMAYTSAFVGQISELQLPYNTDANSFGIVSYWDFSTEAAE